MGGLGRRDARYASFCGRELVASALKILEAMLCVRARLCGLHFPPFGINSNHSRKVPCQRDRSLTSSTPNVNAQVLGGTCICDNPIEFGRVRWSKGCIVLDLFGVLSERSHGAYFVVYGSYAAAAVIAGLL